MNQQLKIITSLLLTSVLAGCASSDDSPFGTGAASSSTNIIADKNFSIFFDEPNPIVIDQDDAGHADVEVTITIVAADRNNALVTGGTVHIRSQWGTLDANSCEISNGSCSVKWTSNGNFNFIPGDLLNSVTAYTLGEESFIDLNGNGYFDDGDGNTFLRDLPEPFEDLNHDGVYTPATDVVIDVDNSGGHTPANGAYNGDGCAHSTLCGNETRIYILDISRMDMLETP
ncbi:MAG: hypothetical protein OQL06_08560 [Gammaproteobacteria bacterium]|nr:hypothetical protein [Gammaproteobacteria bacterium]